MKAYLLKVFYQSIIWIAATSFYGILRQFGQEVVDGPNIDDLTSLVFAYVASGLAIGIILGTVEYIMDKLGQMASFGKLIFVGSIVYLVTLLGAISFGFVIFTYLDNSNDISWSHYKDAMLSKEILLVTAYCSIVICIVQFIKQVNNKFGPGNLWRMLIGVYYKPKEVERLIMFVDLKGSTSIAEKIGHIAYSRLLQDCFKDLNVITKYKANIYQYVGDEVVLIWEKKEGLNDSNYLRAFFAFTSRLKERSDYYTQTYGLVPEFKVGCNLGAVVVAEIGQIKREIAYHGDTINTAARIQGLCNEYGKQFLISERLFNASLDSTTTYSFDKVGETTLKGKSEVTSLYSVHQE